MGKFMVRLIIASLFVSIQRWCIPDIRWTVALLHHKISSMRHRLLKILKSYTENAVNHKKEQDWEFFLLNIDKIITLPPTAQRHGVIIHRCEYEHEWLSVCVSPVTEWWPLQGLEEICQQRVVVVFPFLASPTTRNWCNELKEWKMKSNRTHALRVCWECCGLAAEQTNCSIEIWRAYITQKSSDPRNSLWQSGTHSTNCSNLSNYCLVRKGKVDKLVPKHVFLMSWIKSDNSSHWWRGEFGRRQQSQKDDEMISRVLGCLACVWQGDALSKKHPAAHSHALKSSLVDRLLQRLLFIPSGQ